MLFSMNLRVITTLIFTFAKKKKKKKKKRNLISGNKKGHISSSLDFTKISQIFLKLTEKSTINIFLIVPQKRNFSSCLFTQQQHFSIMILVERPKISSTLFFFTKFLSQKFFLKRNSVYITSQRDPKVIYYITFRCELQICT